MDGIILLVLADVRSTSYGKDALVVCCYILLVVLFSTAIIQGRVLQAFIVAIADSSRSLGS